MSFVERHYRILLVSSGEKFIREMSALLQGGLYQTDNSQGVFVIPKPTSRMLVSQALSLMICARERLRNAEKKAVKAESKLDEIRIVNKAKWMLIDHEGFSEAEAHRYIEKSAMDAGITKRLVAQLIIDSYLK